MARFGATNETYPMTIFATNVGTKTEGETPEETNLCFTENPQPPLDREHNEMVLNFFLEHQYSCFQFWETLHKHVLSLITKIARQNQ